VARSVLVIGAADQKRAVAVTATRAANVFEVAVEDSRFSVSIGALDDEAAEVEIDGRGGSFAVAFAGASLWLDGGRGAFRYDDLSYAPSEPASRETDGVVIARMAGRAVRVDVAEADRVEKGDLLVVLESMKIEHAIAAPVSGRVMRVAVAQGDQVAARSVLIEIEPAVS
jgi:geranyl-CoA carboxylase alpha subunit